MKFALAGMLLGVSVLALLADQRWSSGWLAGTGLATLFDAIREWRNP